MLALERRNIIIERLRRDGKVVVSVLGKEFNVAEETIRRDIEKLAKEDIAVKTYGGAVLKNNNRDTPYLIRKRTNTDLKELIGKRLALYVKDGDRIMVDASSTAIYVIRAIRELKNITIITNSVEILCELSDKTDWTILSTGGSLKGGSLSLFGSSAEKMIRDHHVDIAICSAKGISHDMGITDSNEKDAEMKKAIYGAATTKILALDSTKFDAISFIKVCDIQDVDIVVSDTSPSLEWEKTLKEKGVTLLTGDDLNENLSN